MAEGDELEQLQRLHTEGMLTDAEFEQARAQLDKRGSEDTDATAEEPTDATAEEPIEATAEPIEATAEPDSVPEPDLVPFAEPPAHLEPAQAAEPAPVPAPAPASADPGSDADAAPTRSRRQVPTWVMIAWPIALAAVGVGLIVWALTSNGSGSGKTPVNGLIAIVDHQSVAPDEAVANGSAFGTGGYALGKPCHTLSGYPDIATGAPVVITDAAGKTLAHTKLRPGVFDVNADCVFGFVTSVKKSDSYQIKVGQRDAVTYPAAAIAHPQLSLGGP